MEDDGNENFEVEDEEASAQGLQDSAGQQSMYADDREYYKWLRKWGHVDFNRITYLPYLLSNE